ncbi:MAG TPA: hypothetical protein VGQ83_25145 [Polyangia bacterium]|jgi:hypothetical protein
MLAIGCGSSGTPYNPVIDPANFVAGVTNPYYPLVPGTVYNYSVQKQGVAQDVTITVTSDTKVILGVTCIVVHDLVTEGGQVAEDTWDWYAQDKDGNVWYFGEDTKKYVNGQVDTEGSWEAGVGGAKPGMIMLGNPQVGDTYRQEYLAGSAEDQAEILGLNESITVAAGTYQNCVKTKDWTVLDPGVFENKYFCPDVGQVLADMVQGGSERQELVSITAP